MPHFSPSGHDEVICQICHRIIDTGREDVSWRPDLTGNESAGNACAKCVTQLTAEMAAHREPPPEPVPPSPLGLDRETTLRLFLGLAEAVDEGVIMDVLWMGGDDTVGSTIFEQLYASVGAPDEVAESADIKATIGWLRREIAKDVTDEDDEGPCMGCGTRCGTNGRCQE